MSWNVPESVVKPSNNEAGPLCGQPPVPLSVSVRQDVPLECCEWLTVTGQLPL
jgi:hypothetical protein